MPHVRSALEVLDREFLEIRGKILELAAALDRLDNHPESLGDDQRLAKIREALGVVGDLRGDRAEQVQLIFSRPYHENWRKEFDLKPRV